MSKVYIVLGDACKATRQQCVFLWTTVLYRTAANSIETWTVASCQPTIKSPSNANHDYLSTLCVDPCARAISCRADRNHHHRHIQLITNSNTSFDVGVMLISSTLVEREINRIPTLIKGLPRKATERHQPIFMLN